jgi:hypothetical protein
MILPWSRYEVINNCSLVAISRKGLGGCEERNPREATLAIGSLSVSAAMLLLLAVAIAAPYRWFHYRWYDHGLLAILPGYSLFFAGVLLLITMAGSEWRRAGRERSDDRLDHILISKVPDG